MSTDTEAPIYKKSVLEFKSTSFSVPVLVLYSAELKQVELRLKEKIAQAPEFFKNTPLLIDLKDCNSEDQAIDVPCLIKCLQQNKLCPIGISGGNDEQIEQALEHHIPTHTIRSLNINSNTSTHKLVTENTEKNLAKSSTEVIAPLVENKLVNQPIRSGQRIYAKGDLTILSHVSAGAEVMAEGNIHIYGTLRGRALAGVQGNTESRIFCFDLQAELLSIAGHYKISEEFDKTEHHQPTQVFLQEQALIIKNL
jgi:septum site-determining protein MinC